MKKTWLTSSFLSVSMVWCSLPAAYAEDLATSTPAAVQPATYSHPELGTSGSPDSLVNNSQLVLDISKYPNGMVDFKGDLNNTGVILAVSTDPTFTTATLSATNFFNSGQITTVIPQTGIAGYQNLVPGLNLVLFAQNDIFNSGIISSAGNLGLTAGGTIENAGNQNIGSGCIQAVQDLTFQTSNLVNSGLIASQLANVQIQGQIGSDLVVNNIGGTIWAKEQLAFSTQPSQLASVLGILQAENLSVIGGDLIAETVNLTSVGGLAKINVENLVGNLDISAAEAHVAVNTETLYLNQICLTGDPTFFNQTGDIIINTDLVFAGEHLALVSGQNILSAAGVGQISTASSTGNGGDITIVAGAAFDILQGDPSKPFEPVSLSIKGPSATGGRIDLASVPISSLESSSTFADGSGGSIKIIAFEGVLANSGSIRLPQAVTIKTGGEGTGTNGNVSIVAGAGSGVGVSMGGVDTTGGAPGTGHVSIISANPGSNLNVQLINAKIVSGSFNASTPAYIGLTTGAPLCTFCLPTTILNSSSVSATNIRTDGANATIAAGSVGLTSINVSGLDSSSGGVTVVDSRSSAVFRVGSGPVSNGVASSINADAGPNGGGGGSIYLLRRGDISINVDQLSVRATDGKGGRIVITGSGTGSPTAEPTTGAVLLTGTLGLHADAQAASGAADGGMVAILGSAITTTNHLNISADGAAAGHGGSIYLHSKSAPVRIANTGPAFSISAVSGADGGNGGSATVKTGGAIDVDGAAIDVTPRGANGNGGTISLGTRGTSGEGGNYILGNPYATTVTSLNLSGNFDVSGRGIGDGGNFNVSTDLDGSADISATSINADAGNMRGSGGRIWIQTKPFQTLQLGLNYGTPAEQLKVGTFSAKSTGVSAGGYIRVNTNATLVLPAGTISVNGARNTIDDGIIHLAGASLVVVPYGGLQHLHLEADGTGAGHGGTVTLYALADVPNAIPIGSGDLHISTSATGGPGGAGVASGGKLFIQTNGALTLDPANINVSPLGLNGHGGTVHFLSNTSMLITGDINTSGNGTGGGGSITLFNGNGLNDGQAFIVGGGASTTRGVQGALISLSPQGQSGAINVGASGPTPIDISSDTAIQLTSPRGNGNLKLLTNGGTIQLPYAAADPVTKVLEYDMRGSAGLGNLEFRGRLNIPADVKLRLIAGSVTLGSSSSNGADYSLGGLAGQLQVRATDFFLTNTGGSFTVTDSTGLRPLQNGFFGTFSLNASDVFINSPLYAGQFGRNASITVTGNSPFQVGPNATTFGITGPVEFIGPQATITSNSGLSVESFNTLTFAPGTAVTLNSNGGNLILGDGTIDVSTPGNTAVFSDRPYYGSVSLYSQHGIEVNGHLEIRANGGGTVNIQADGSAGPTSPIHIGAGAGQIGITATGGDGASSLGKGGTASIVNRNGDIYLDTAALDLSENFAGNSFPTLSIATGGNFVATGDIDLSGNISGPGGLLNLSLESPNSQLGIGTGSGAQPSKILGNIIVDSVNGQPGSINIRGNSSLSIDLSGEISAHSNAGNFGSLNVANLTGGSLNSFNLQGNGILDAILNVQANSINVTMQSPAPLQLGQINANDAAFTNSGPILATGSVVATNNLSMSSANIQNNGLLQAGNTLVFQNMADLSLTGTGTVVAPLIRFISNTGAVSAFQSNFFGAVVASAPGGFTISQGAPMSTEQLLGRGTSTSVNSLPQVLLFSTPRTSFSDSTVIATDVIRRDISFPAEDDTEAGSLVKLPDGSLVATGGNVLISGVSDTGDDIEVAEDGTEVVEETQTLILRKGTCLIDTGAKAKRVKTSSGVATVQPNSTAVLTATPDGKVSAVVLNGSTQFDSAGSVTSTVVAKGQVLQIDSRGISDEELIPLEGLGAGEVIEAGLARGVRTSIKRELNRNQFVSKDIFIRGVLVRVKGMDRRSNTRLRDRLTQDKTKDSALRGVGWIQPSVLPPNQASQTASLPKNFFIASEPGAQFAFKAQGNVLTLAQGAIVVKPSQSITIETCNSNVQVPAGHVVDLQSDGKDTVTVRACSGTGTNVVFNNRIVKLMPGQELVLSTSRLASSDFTKDSLARRRTLISHAPDIHVAMSEFSILSLLRIADRLKNVRTSKDSASKQVLGELLKTSICLQMVCSHHGPYVSSVKR